MKRKVANRILECFLCHTIIKGDKISNLRRHIRLHYPKTNCVRCEICKTTFQNKTNGKVHWMKKHANSYGAAPKMTSTTRKTKRKQKFERNLFDQFQNLF